MTHFLGVDLGSTTAKVVILDAAGEMRAAEVVQMGAVSRAGCAQAMETALGAAGIPRDEVAAAVATGYGRRLVPGVDRSFTEITCHARGAAAMCPGVRLVVDIGGQDSKAIAVDGDGIVENFAMNDRCASGTGRFFEVLARAVECDLDELAGLALAGRKELEVSSMCATFAETELISLLAQGEDREDIAASVHRAVATRTVGLVAQVGRRAPVVMTGGVARNTAAVHFLAEALHEEITVPSSPQITGAYGAALLARDGAGRGARGAGETIADAREPARSCATCEVAAAMPGRVP
ncbi:2-hydroxyglutaryl-CoA dehydratase [Actinomycetospora sp. NBRC 106375]|uniref:acyl-CoA dehydratase activase n=1 Tax=Actinomycetospora sp. NBRC 106375 TaxID=3032207 RepID=UPI0024A5AC26|nr:acyl-CoA dehydratase activase [Actinomycetospora sp. NBRC 106375]GLZ48148.1 2-hydroxyglutaryl-CoA dehydratase [Actinomycetospora sp. NBRC 106375]